MTREISQRELRNDNGEIMRSSTTVRPSSPRSAAGVSSPPIDRKRFRADLDAVTDQDPRPRG